jgi:hypothetical protein
MLLPRSGDNPFDSTKGYPYRWFHLGDLGAAEDLTPMVVEKSSDDLEGSLPVHMK